MRIDASFAVILSDFLLDIAKAIFIATFITPPLNNLTGNELVPALTKGLLPAILFLLLSWQFAKLGENYEQY